LFIRYAVESVIIRSLNWIIVTYCSPKCTKLHLSA